MEPLNSGKRLIPASPEPWPMLPDDLFIEILKLLLAKDLGRCKCVCKSWRSIIKSSTFQVIYRKYHSSLMLYTSKNSGTGDGDIPTHLFRFYYSHLRRLNDPIEDSIRSMSELSIPAGIFFDQGIKIVNGLVCIATSEKGFGLDVQLTIYNVCTGEKMTVPDPVPYVSTVSTFHLGYDPASKSYKLLRFIFRTNKRGAVLSHDSARANIITLRPSDSVSRWRRLNSKAAGLADMGETEYSLYHIVRSENTADKFHRKFSGDHGILCWFRYSSGGLITFDLNKERFRRVGLPTEFARTGGTKRVVGYRAEYKESGRLDLTMWVERFHSLDDTFIPSLQCFVLEEDDEGEIWSWYNLQYPPNIPRPVGLQEIAMGSSDSGEIMFVVPYSVCDGVYCYSCQTDRIEEFWIGNFRADPDFRTGGRLSCLDDSNHLYLSLNDVLNGIF